MFPVIPSGRGTRTRLAAALLLAALAATGGRAAERQKFTLATLGRDGVMIPFASFDGRDWGLHWPDSDAVAPLPISRDDIPKKWWGPQGPDAPWTAWLTGGETRPLTLGKPVHAKVFCSGHPALATDYRGGPIDLREPTVPKDGLAIAGDAKLQDDHPGLRARGRREARDRRHHREFNMQEKLAAEHFTSWSHPFWTEERKRYPIELEAFYRDDRHDVTRHVEDDLCRGDPAVPAEAVGRGLRADHLRARLDHRAGRQEAGHQHRRARDLLRPRGGRIHAAVRAPDGRQRHLLGLPDLELAQ